MCRLFGLSAAPRRVTATFWLLDAPDSLAVQSRREPDGVGLGVFEPDGTALVRPLAPGELLHVADDQHLTSQIAFDRPPAHQLTLTDLHPQAAASQRPGADAA
jgi:hypothetical protein